MGALLAVSDLHVGHSGNRHIVEAIAPSTPDDWLIVAGDVAEKSADIRWALELLRSRFAKVIWVPGNHELWCLATDPLRLRGVERYQYLVDMCRSLDVVTPEDEFPVWPGESARLPGVGGLSRGPVIVVPLFLLYDYSFLPRGARSRAEGLAIAERHGAVSTDEYLLAVHPYDDVVQWCSERIEYSRTRLADVEPSMPLVMVSHYPLVRDPTRTLLRSEFAMWCGTEKTARWHLEYNVVCAVYGHLHIRGSTHIDGVRFEEVSVGYPREWQRRGVPTPLLRQILPDPAHQYRRGWRRPGSTGWWDRAARIAASYRQAVSASQNGKGR